MGKHPLKYIVCTVNGSIYYEVCFDVECVVLLAAFQLPSHCSLLNQELLPLITWEHSTEYTAYCTPPSTYSFYTSTLFTLHALTLHLLAFHCPHILPIYPRPPSHFNLDHPLTLPSSTLPLYSRPPSHSYPRPL